MEMKSISTMALIATVALITESYFSNEAFAQEAQPSGSEGMKFIGAGLAFGLAALGAGVAIGGVLGILFAPDKGSETRHKIAEGSKKLADNFNRKIKSGNEKCRKNFVR